MSHICTKNTLINKGIFILWRLMNDVRISLVDSKNMQYMQCMTEFAKTCKT